MDAAGNDEEFFGGVWLAGFCIFGDGKDGNGEARDTVSQNLHLNMWRLIVYVDLFQ